MSRFSESVFGLRKPERKLGACPIKISVSPEIHTQSRLERFSQAKAENIEKQQLTVSGETRDLSENGLSFIVPSIRLDSCYLVGSHEVLEMEIDLPNGRVKLEAVGCRYEQIEDLHASAGRFLVGAKISRIAEKDRALLADFLRGEKTAGRLRQQNLGLDIKGT